MGFISKKFLNFLLFFMCLLPFRLAAPLSSLNSNGITDAETLAGYFQGDMILDAMQQQIINGDMPLMMARNVIAFENYRWPDKTVYYKISAEFPKDYQNAILEAFAHISKSTCIKFVKATANTKGFMNFVPSTSGCSSEVGYRGREQRVNLAMNGIDRGCFTLGSIVHEILHGLGFYHQQSDPNRDRFVFIDESNIAAGKQFNFNILPETLVNNYGVPYDYESLMHYSAYAFTKNGKATIVPFRKNPAKPIGQRRELSAGDIKKINTMYDCPV